MTDDAHTDNAHTDNTAATAVPSKAVSHRRGAVALVLLLALVGGTVWVLKYREQGTSARFEATAHVPKAAVGVFWTGTLAEIATGLTEVGARIKGSAGLRDAAALLIGVKSLTAAGLTEVGLEAEAGVAGFIWDDAAWLAVPVRSRAGADHLLNLLQRRGHQVEALPAVGSRSFWQIHTRAGDAIAGHSQLEGGVLLTRMVLPTATAATPTDARIDAFDAWRAAPKLAGSEAESGAKTPGGRLLHARWRLDKDDPIRSLVRRSLGPASLLFGRFVGSFTDARLDVLITNGAPTVTMKLNAPPDQAAEMRRYHRDFVQDDQALIALGGVLPDEVTAVVRARINPNLVSMVAGLLALGGGIAGDLLDPELRSLDLQPLLLAPFDGQIAVALLGVSDDATPDLQQWRGTGWRKLAGVAAAVALRTDTDATAVIDRVRSRLQENSATFANVSLGEWRGIRRTGGRTSWALLRRDRGVFVILGEGEWERFDRVARGKFPSLGSTLQGPLENAVTSGKGQWLSAVVTTGRTVRSARRRGIPNSITSMVASVSAVALGVDLLDDGVRISASIRPRSAKMRKAK